MVSLRLSFVLAVGLILAVSGCGQETGAPADISEAEGGDGNTIRVEFNFYTPGMVPQGIGEPVKKARELADEWERLHPGKKITYRMFLQTSNTEGEWLKTQLLGGIAPEIISMNAEVSWQDVGKGWYVPLDEYLERPNLYVPGNQRWMDTFANQALVQAKRAPDGKLYCIPIDIVETGVFYNKTLLRAHGFERMPETWAEMMAMFDTLNKAGVTPMTSDNWLGSDWGQDIIFEMLYHDILPQLDLVPSRPDAEGYLDHYLEPQEAGFLFTKGFFTRQDPRWREVNRILKDWRRGWAKELKNADPLRSFLIGRLAMFWTGSWFIRRIAMDPYVDFEWDVAYIPTITKETSPYGPGTPATVIGGAAVQLHVTNSALINGNLEDCIDFLMFVSAPQSIEALASEALIFIPNIVGAKVDERLAPFQEIFKRRYCAIKWLDSFDGEPKKYWRRMLDYYLNDGVDLDGYLEMLEENFAHWVELHRNEAAWDFEPMERVWQERETELLQELQAS
ncbi:MAG TPA: extracellular solute-binding protein [Candidatus Bathyarchaeia archaeon]|nr:extracellular solute-binding protein [Candidatus Bathyarchaeia archaeon]